MGVKKIISPLQSWLLARDRCVKCAAPLSQGKKTSGDAEIISCKCGRLFVFDKNNNSYRRALFDEV